MFKKHVKPHYCAVRFSYSSILNKHWITYRRHVIVFESSLYTNNAALLFKTETPEHVHLFQCSVQIQTFWITSQYKHRVKTPTQHNKVNTCKPVRFTTEWGIRVGWDQNNKHLMCPTEPNHKLQLQKYIWSNSRAPAAAAVFLCPPLYAQPAVQGRKARLFI